jgi:hypothetical protein
MPSEMVWVRDWEDWEKRGVMAHTIENSKTDNLHDIMC